LSKKLIMLLEKEVKPFLYQEEDTEIGEPDTEEGGEEPSEVGEPEELE